MAGLRTGTVVFAASKTRAAQPAGFDVLVASLGMVRRIMSLILSLMAAPSNPTSVSTVLG